MSKTNDTNQKVRKPFTSEEIEGYGFVYKANEVIKDDKTKEMEEIIGKQFEPLKAQKDVEIARQAEIEKYETLYKAAQGKKSQKIMMKLVGNLPLMIIGTALFVALLIFVFFVVAKATGMQKIDIFAL